MKIGKIVIGAVLVIIGLPLVVILVTVVSVAVLDRTNGAIYSRAGRAPTCSTSRGATTAPSRRRS
jgi:hypothetical protein